MVNLVASRLSVSLGARTVVDAVDAEFAAGTLTGIIGPNGAGKSSLVKAMLGLLPAASGSVLLNGEDISRLHRRDVARQLSYLPQGQSLHWPLSVERLVALGRLPHLGPLSRIGHDDAQAIAAAMRRTDVDHLGGRDAAALSGGERARVLMARALAVEARGLIADEPLAALDAGHQIEVMEMLRAEAQSGAMVIAVLHDLAMAARFCSRLLLMHEGRIVASGKPRDVLTEEHLREIYGITAHLDFESPEPIVVPLNRIAPIRE